LEVLRRITTALDRAGIAYMLTGSFAGAHHGAPRSTLDINIVTYLEQWISELDLKQEWTMLNASLEFLKTPEPGGNRRP
jgi:hypothetical protein